MEGSSEELISGLAEQKGGIMPGPMPKRTDQVRRRIASLKPTRWLLMSWNGLRHLLSGIHLLSSGMSRFRNPLFPVSFNRLTWHRLELLGRCFLISLTESRV